MTKRIRRRFLLLAITLLMTLSLIGSSSRQEAATETCDECLAYCEDYYYTCMAVDGDFMEGEYCAINYRRCVSARCQRSGACPTP